MVYTSQPGHCIALGSTVMCLSMLFPSPTLADKGITGGLTERGCPYSREFDYLGDGSNTAMFFV